MKYNVYNSVFVISILQNTYGDPQLNLIEKVQILLKTTPFLIFPPPNYPETPIYTTDNGFIVTSILEKP